MPFCPKCGKEVTETRRFCPNCGADTQAPRQEIGRDRPTGITIMAVLQGLAGVGGLLLGVLMVLVAGFIGTIEIPELPGFFTGVVAAFIGLVLLLLGILSFAVSYGYWNGRGWAWTIGIIINVLGVLSSLASGTSGVFGLVLNVIILYYLTRPHVKRYFGKEPRTITI